MRLLHSTSFLPQLLSRNFSWTPWAANVGSLDGPPIIFGQFADPDMRERLFGYIVLSQKRGGILVLRGCTPKQLTHKTGGHRRLRIFTPKRYC